MHKLSDVVHMDINVFGSLSLYCISGYSNCSLVFIIDDIGHL